LFKSPEILKLRDEKQRLLVESELNRRAIIAELEQLANPRTWVQTGKQSLLKARSLFLLLAPLAGFLLARRRPAAPSVPGILSKGLIAWQILRKIYSVWQFLQSRMR
jgi:hypothetical protein